MLILGTQPAGYEQAQAVNREAPRTKINLLAMSTSHLASRANILGQTTPADSTQAETSCPYSANCSFLTYISD